MSNAGGSPRPRTAPHTTKETEVPDLSGLVTMGQLKTLTLDFFWKPWIPRGCLSLIAGLPETGKSTLVAALIADLAGGPRLTPGQRKRKLRVLLMAGEENHNTLTRPRLVAAGAKKELVTLFSPGNVSGESTPFYLPSNLTRLRDWILHLDISMVVFDPVTRYGDPGMAWKDEGPTRMVLDPLADLAAELNVAIIIVRNPNKEDRGELLNRISGSAAFRDVPRSIIYTMRNPERQTELLLLHAKTSTGEHAPITRYSLPFRAGVPRFTLGEATTLRAEELMDKTDDPGKIAERQGAVGILKALLDSGPMSVEDICKAIKSESISKDVLYRTKAKLKIGHKRNGFGQGSRSIWFKPKKGWPAEE